MPVPGEHVLLIDSVIGGVSFVWISGRILFCQDPLHPDINREGIQVMKPEQRDTVCNLYADAVQGCQRGNRMMLM